MMRRTHAIHLLIFFLMYCTNRTVMKYINLTIIVGNKYMQAVIAINMGDARKTASVVSTSAVLSMLIINPIHVNRVAIKLVMRAMFHLFWLVMMPNAIIVVPINCIADALPGYEFLTYAKSNNFSSLLPR